MIHTHEIVLLCNGRGMSMLGSTHTLRFPDEASAKAAYDALVKARDDSEKRINDRAEAIEIVADATVSVLANTISTVTIYDRVALQADAVERARAEIDLMAIAGLEPTEKATFRLIRPASKTEAP